MKRVKVHKIKRGGREKRKNGRMEEGRMVDGGWWIVDGG